MYFVEVAGLTRASSSITILLVVLATVSATITTDLGALSVATQNNSLLYHYTEAGDMTVTYRQLATSFEKAMAKYVKVTNATISGSYIPYIIDVSNSSAMLTINNEYLSQVMHAVNNGQQDRRRWNYYIGRARSYIVNTVSNHFGSSDVIHKITDGAAITSYNFEVINRYLWRTSETVSKPCNTDCSTIEENGYSYNFCFYIFTKYGESCSFYNTEDLIDATIAAIQDEKISYRGSLKVGACATIYNSSSSVIYVKWKLLGSETYFEDIWCEGVEGWRVPNPNAGNTGTNC
ncbi:hypothetical protein V1509DRAFT_208160 [Lipomyces kononenkoae]